MLFLVGAFGGANRAFFGVFCQITRLLLFLFALTVGFLAKLQSALFLFLLLLFVVLRLERRGAFDIRLGLRQGARGHIIQTLDLCILLHLTRHRHFFSSALFHHGPQLCIGQLEVLLVSIQVPVKHLHIVVPPLLRRHLLVRYIVQVHRIETGISVGAQSYLLGTVCKRAFGFTLHTDGCFVGLFDLEAGHSWLDHVLLLFLAALASRRVLFAAVSAIAVFSAFLVIFLLRLSVGAAVRLVSATAGADRTLVGSSIFFIIFVFFILLVVLGIRVVCVLTRGMYIQS